MKKSGMFAVIVFLTLALGVSAFFNSRRGIIIGIFKEDLPLFADTKILSERLGKPVHLQIYKYFRDMERDAADGSLDVFISPLFAHIADPKGYLAISAIEADYALAGNISKDPIPIGAFEPYVSQCLIDHCAALAEKKISLLSMEESEREAYLSEKIIDFAVFRKKSGIPHNRSLPVVQTMSAIGFSHDLIVAKKSLLETPGFSEAFFSSLATERHILPPEREVKQAIRYLFKHGMLKERKRYTDFVHIE